MRGAAFSLLFLTLVTGCARTSATVKEDPKYRLLIFKPSRANKHYPLLLVLHGTGQTPQNYFKIWKKEAIHRKVMVLAPAIENLDLEKFYELIEEIARQYPVDHEKVLLAGISSGALVARWLLVKRPAFWKGAILVASPTGEPWAETVDVKNFPPILFVHGGKDNQFKLSEIAQQVEILKKRGVDTTLFSYPGAGHEQRPEWSRRIFDWLEARLDYSTTR